MPESKEKRGGCAEAAARTTQCLLLLLLVGVTLRCATLGEWSRVAIGAISFLLLLLPAVIERALALRLPPLLRIFAYLFAFAAGVLGEMAGFYQRFYFFDAVLHLTSGFLFAAFGFCLFALFEGERLKKVIPSPLFLAFLAFCFSLSVGVVWEMLEYAADTLLHTDMQKDRVVQEIYSVLLQKQGIPALQGIVTTQIRTADGASFELPGYLDVGLHDTMKDLALNLVGAALFCVMGYLRLSGRGGAPAERLIPRVEKRG